MGFARGRLSISEEPTQEKKVRLKMELMGYSPCGWYTERALDPPIVLLKRGM